MFLIVKQKQVLLLFSFSVYLGAWRNIASPPTLSGEVSSQGSSAGSATVGGGGGWSQWGGGGGEAAAEEDELLLGCI